MLGRLLLWLAATTPALEEAAAAATTTALEETCGPLDVRILSRDDADEHANASALWPRALPNAVVGPKNRVALAGAYADEAAAAGEAGDGRSGWLNLLASHDLDPSPWAAEQLVANYRAAGYDSLADGVARTPAAARPKVAPTGEFVAPFAALVGRWDLSAPPLGPEAVADGNRALYAAAARAYDAVRARLPADTTATGVNHALFEWQMRVLRKTGAVAASLGAVPLWADVQTAARGAARELLAAHGGDPAKVDAATCVSWISVHVVGDSVHEPHNTDDSLVGGVYYVSVPPGSQDLALYDPRGARPFDAGGDGGGGRRVARPDAPFHRTVELPAAEGVLVLFPGWMVHQVLPSAASSRASETYRVSISVNFKGEWQDTTGLSLAFPPGTTFGS